MIIKTQQICLLWCGARPKNIESIKDIIKTSLKIFKHYKLKPNSDPIWSSLSQVEPSWSNLIQLDQVCAKLNQIDPI